MPFNDSGLVCFRARALGDLRHIDMFTIGISNNNNTIIITTFEQFYKMKLFVE